MKILFLGGSGFFGISFIRYLVKNNISCSITIASRKPHSLKDKYKFIHDLKWIDFKIVDILDTKSFDSIKDGDYSHIIHAAADSTNVEEICSIGRIDQIIDGTKNILELVKERFSDAKFLFISSGGVYGSMPENMSSFHESLNTIAEPFDLSSSYSIAKRTAEHLCFVYRKQFDIDIKIARCFAFSGPDLPTNVHFAIGNFVKDALLNKNIYINCDGTPIRSYLDQYDLSEWILKICDYKKSDNFVFNVGSDKGISIFDLATKIQLLINPSCKVKVLGKNLNNQRNNYIPNTEKAKSILGLSEKISLDQSILSMSENIFLENEKP